MKSKLVCKKLFDENQFPITDPSNIVKLFQFYCFKLASSNIDSSSPTSGVSDMDMLDQILDIDIIVEEIDATFTALTCGCSKGTDGLNSEHPIYGGDLLKLW